MRAELWAAALGLSLAWDMGFRQVNIQLDSIAAIAAIKGNPDSESLSYSSSQLFSLTLPP
ncbi:hypothetical protein LINPERPRIM_LOCUS30076 [Linum perenne]